MENENPLSAKKLRQNAHLLRKTEQQNDEIKLLRDQLSDAHKELKVCQKSKERYVEMVDILETEISKYQNLLINYAKFSVLKPNTELVVNNKNQGE